MARIDGISGTSAGAMNAAVLVYGHRRAAPQARVRRSTSTGAAYRAPPASARCSVAARRDARAVDARFLAHICRDGSDVAGVVAL